MNKTIKGYGIYSEKDLDIAETVFTSKKKATRYFNATLQAAQAEFPNLPKIHMDKLLSNYSIIPISIIYKKPKFNE